MPAVPALVANGTVPVTLAPTILDNPPPSPVNRPVFAVNAGAVIRPLTPNELKVPKDVTFGCAAVVKLPVNVEPATS